LFAGKKRELRGGKPFMHVGSLAFDQKLMSLYHAQRTWWNAIDGTYITTRLHLCAEYIEKIGLHIVEKIVHVLSRARDVTTGKDVHKSKGHIALKYILKLFID
jgi:hypothetical protein